MKNMAIVSMEEYNYLKKCEKYINMIYRTFPKKVCTDIFSADIKDVENIIYEIILNTHNKLKRENVKIISDKN